MSVRRCPESFLCVLLVLVCFLYPVLSQDHRLGKLFSLSVCVCVCVCVCVRVPCLYDSLNAISGFQFRAGSHGNNRVVSLCSSTVFLIYGAVLTSTLRV